MSQLKVTGIIQPPKYALVTDGWKDYRVFEDGKILYWSALSQEWGNLHQWLDEFETIQKIGLAAFKEQEHE